MSPCVMRADIAAARRELRRTSTAMWTASNRAGDRNWQVMLAGSSPAGTSAAIARTATAAT